MSLFSTKTLPRKPPSKIHYSQYIRTENKEGEDPGSTPQPKESPKPANQDEQ